MCNNLSIKDIKGGDTVRLKNGKVVKVNDLKNGYIVVASDEWYHIKDVAEIVKKFSATWK